MIDRNQFTFNLDEKKNSFKQSVNSGDFVVLFEIDPPSSDCNISTVISRYKPFIKDVNGIEGFNSGIAITDGKTNRDSFDVFDFASELIDGDRSRHVLFLSGRGRTQEELINLIKACATGGFWNVVPVSGNIFKEDTEKSVCKEKFAESVSVINSLKDDGELYKALNLGGGINPFKYSQVSLHTQFFKLIKKLHAGTNFIVVQAGWDILKQQELRWYLEGRGIFEPCLGRVILLKPEIIEQIITGSYHGIFMSPDFLSILKKESKFGLSQFWVAQWRRFELQVAGLRWMGYNGIIISGVENEAYVKTAISKVNSALKEFSSFEDWKEAYLNFLARSEMFPYPYKYYKYSNLLETPFADSAKLSSDEELICTNSEKFRYYLNKFQAEGFSFGKPKKEHLSRLFYCSPKSCPKGMLHGVCGEMNHDGTCCLNSQKECLYSKMFKIALWKNDFEPFERE